jgi:proteasome lid subunit RPN8/RPN11
VLRLPQAAHDEIIAHALDNAPFECCGLVAGRGNKAEEVYRMVNAETESPTTRYVLDSREQFSVMKDAEREGRDVIACFHSHTHTEAYPSPTDVERAAYPEWWYLIVTLKAGIPMLRAYRIVDGTITEDSITLERSGKPEASGQRGR